MRFAKKYPPFFVMLSKWNIFNLQGELPNNIEKDLDFKILLQEIARVTNGGDKFDLIQVHYQPFYLSTSMHTSKCTYKCKFVFTSVAPYIYAYIQQVLKIVSHIICNH